MKKYMELLKNNIRINKNLFIFLFVLVIVGLASGAIFSVIISESDKSLVSEYLKDFFNKANSGNLDYHNCLINSFIFTIGCGLLIWILGISIIGFFIVIFILFLKSFIIGFSIGSILLTFKIKGILYVIVYTFPHHIINILIFMLLSAYALVMSYRLIYALKSKKTVDFKGFINKYLIVLFFSLFMLLISCIYEVYGLDKIIKIVISIFPL